MSFSKQIGRMEVWAKSYKESDVKSGLKDLEEQQLKLNKKMAELNSNLAQSEVLRIQVLCTMYVCINFCLKGET